MEVPLHWKMKMYIYIILFFAVLKGIAMTEKKDELVHHPQQLEELRGMHQEEVFDRKRKPRPSKKKRPKKRPKKPAVKPSKLPTCSGTVGKPIKPNKRPGKKPGKKSGKKPGKKPGQKPGKKPGKKPVDGVWTAWGNFGTCSVTCGDGTKTRERTCNCPAPANGGNDCPGSDQDTDTCNHGDCLDTTPTPTTTTSTTPALPEEISHLHAIKAHRIAAETIYEGLKKLGNSSETQNISIFTSHENKLLSLLNDSITHLQNECTSTSGNCEIKKILAITEGKHLTFNSIKDFNKVSSGFLQAYEEYFKKIDEVAAVAEDYHTSSSPLQQSKDCVKEDNIDYYGNDISGSGGVISANNADECSAACSRNDKCEFWTYGDYLDYCWMKYAKYGRRYKYGVISGNKACGQVSCGLVREQVAYTGCGFTYVEKIDRDNQCGSGGTTKLIIDSYNGGSSCGLYRAQPVYPGCGYTYLSEKDCNKQCGRQYCGNSKIIFDSWRPQEVLVSPYGNNDEKLSKNVLLKYFNRNTPQSRISWWGGGKKITFTGSVLDIEDENSFLTTNIQTKFISHGFHGASSQYIYCDNWIQNYFKYDQQNIQVICINWEKLAFYGNWDDATGGIYYREAQNGIDVGWFLGHLLHSLVKKTGLDIDNVHLIGNSLGAHTVGMMGRIFKKLSGKKVYRVTGLDPAGPLFTKKNEYGLNEHKIGKDSGDFVDIIHTNGNFDPQVLSFPHLAHYGNLNPLGHADFYVNGGMNQKASGCIFGNGVCSHRRAMYYYLQSINDKKTAFPSYLCKSPESCSKEEKTSDTVDNYMGEFINTRHALPELYYIAIKKKLGFYCIPTQC